MSLTLVLSFLQELAPLQICDQLKLLIYGGNLTACTTVRHSFNIDAIKYVRELDVSTLLSIGRLIPYN